MTLRQTHTYATLEVSAAAYDEIAAKLKAAGYDHAFMEDGAIDMHGIGITRGAQAAAAGTMTEEAVLELARKIAAVPGVESFKGGPDHRQARIQVILNEALGVGRAKPVITPAVALEAWANAVRAEWMAYVEADPELKAQHAVALDLMREDGYSPEENVIVGIPGMEPYVCTIDGKKAVCFDYSMRSATPLSAIYTNKVRTVQSAAARVAKALAEEAVKQPPEWPIKIATGETFNSIEEMERSPIHAVREMAKLMRERAECSG